MFEVLECVSGKIRFRMNQLVINKFNADQTLKNVWLYLTNS
jgi:hypothetical protein